MISVLYVTDTMEEGGSLNQLTSLLCNVPNSIKATVVFGNSPALEPTKHMLASRNITVITVPVTKPKDMRWYGYLKSIIQDVHTDIIHAHLNHSGSCRYLFFANKSHIPIVATEHDPFPLSPLKKLIKKETLRRTSHTIAVSTANADFLVAEYDIAKDRISVVHNGIEPLKTEPKTKKRESIVKIGGIMELHERKGPDILIEAFNQIHTEYANTELHIAGTGKMKERLGDQIRQYGLHDAVTLHGWVSDIDEFLNNIDIFVLPSRREAFGLVVLEALMRKKPVIASNTGGIPDILRDGKDGLLFEREKTSSLVEKLKFLINNEKQCFMIAEEGYTRAKNNFSTETMTDKTVSLYKSYVN